MKQKLSLMTIIGSAVLLSLTVPALGGTFLPIDLNDLVALSDVVVTGEVTSRYCLWNEDHTIINTHYSLLIQTTHFGSTQDSIVTLVIPGGVIDDLGMSVAGTPDFEVGDQLLLFIVQMRENQWRVEGWKSGSYRLLKHGDGNAYVCFDYDWNPIIGFDKLKAVTITDEIQGNRISQSKGDESIEQSFSEDTSMAITLSQFTTFLNSLAAKQKLHGYSGRYVEKVRRH